MFIPDTGSEFFPTRILDPNFFHPGSTSKIQIIILPIPDPNPGVKKAPDPGSATQLQSLGYLYERWPSAGRPSHRWDPGRGRWWRPVLLPRTVQSTVETHNNGTVMQHVINI
jgi:hypothetical protein